MSGELEAALGDVHAALEKVPGLRRALPDGTEDVLADPAKLDPLRAVQGLDAIAFHGRRSLVRAELTAALDAARSALAGPLGGRRLSFTPGLGALPRDLASLPSLRLQVTEVPWPAPRGTVVALERRGFEDSRVVMAVIAPHVHVASGAPRSERLELLEAALVAIEAARPSAEDHERLLRLIDGIERDEPRANSEAAVRFAVSCLERARAVPRALQVALAFLAARGLQPIALAPGERFDPERHAAQAFERRLVRGPLGRVVATEAIGFRDEKGVILSRATVAVGDGS